MIERIEKSTEDVYASMMELEAEITKNKLALRENMYDENATLQFSMNIFSLFVKRVKHGFFKRGEFEKARKFEELIDLNTEAIGHHISSNAITVMMNMTMYDIKLEDTFMQLLKDYAEYLKPILIKVI